MTIKTLKSVTFALSAFFLCLSTSAEEQKTITLFGNERAQSVVTARSAEFSARKVKFTVEETFVRDKPGHYRATRLAAFEVDGVDMMGSSAAHQPDEALGRLWNVNVSTLECVGGGNPMTGVWDGSSCSLKIPFSGMEADLTPQEEMEFCRMLITPDLSATLGCFRGKLAIEL